MKTTCRRTERQRLSPRTERGRRSSCRLYAHVAFAQKQRLMSGKADTVGCQYRLTEHRTYEISAELSDGSPEGPRATGSSGA